MAAAHRCILLRTPRCTARRPHPSGRTLHQGSFRSGRGAPSSCSASRNVHLIAADDPINTYDLVELADLGWYTQPRWDGDGNERGSGDCHRANALSRQGLHLDPDSWQAYENCWSRCSQILALTGSRRPRSTRPGIMPTASSSNTPAISLAPAVFLGRAAEWPVDRVLSPKGRKFTAALSAT